MLAAAACGAAQATAVNPCHPLQVGGVDYIVAAFHPGVAGGEDSGMALQGLACIAQWSTARSREKCPAPMGVAGYRMEPTNGHAYNVFGQKKLDKGVGMAVCPR